MKLKYLLSMVLMVFALCLATTAGAYARPWIYRMLPSSGSYSIVLGVSPDATKAVGVSSNAVITVNANGELATPAFGQTYYPTVWDLTSIPAPPPYQVTGTTLSGFSGVNAALHAVSSDVSGVHTYVGTTWTAGGTTGFYNKSGTTTALTTGLGQTSYGFGIGGNGGNMIVTGWANTAGTSRPCFYVINPPAATTGGLYYFSAGSGSAHGIASPGALMGTTLYSGFAGGTDGGAAALWSIYYTRASKTSPWTGPYVGSYTGEPTSGCNFGITRGFNNFNNSTTQYACGRNSSSGYSYIYSTAVSSYAGSYADTSITGTAYDMLSNTFYVGQDSAASAFFSPVYFTHGDLYTWLAGFNWGPITPPNPNPPYNAFGIGDWSSLTAAYRIGLSNSTTFYYVGGYGNSLGAQTGFVTIFL